MITVTLDTNCFDTDRNATQILEELNIRQTKNKIKVFHEIQTETETNQLDSPRKLDIWRNMYRVSNLKSGSCWIPTSVEKDKELQYIESQRGYSTAELDETYRKAIQIIFPEGLDGKNFSNKHRDVMIFTKHVLNKRDIFVTKDKHFLRKKEQLEKTFAIKVMKLDQELMNYLDKETGKVLK